ncbi:MAG: hypothetical protein ISS93_00155 [Candidatus Aenigmarchaeota archaeon]|nr:hypothetical protein [Candidatus Aenigmarchaeota archaeon]
METGESMTLKRKDYTIHYIKPCTVEKGKKMAKIRLKNPPAGICNKLKKTFSDAKCFPNLGVTRIERGRKQIIIFQNGEIVIRSAENEKDVIKTADAILKALK